MIYIIQIIFIILKKNYSSQRIERVNAYGYTQGFEKNKKSTSNQRYGGNTKMYEVQDSKGEVSYTINQHFQLTNNRGSKLKKCDERMYTQQVAEKVYNIRGRDNSGTMQGVILKNLMGQSMAS